MYRLWTRAFNFFRKLLAHLLACYVVNCFILNSKVLQAVQYTLDGR